MEKRNPRGGWRILVTCLLLLAAALATGASAADPPIVQGGIGGLDGSQTASAEAGSDGAVNACVAGQTVTIAPSTDPASLIKIGDACSTEGGASSTSGGTGGPQSSAGGGGASGSGATGSSTSAGGASASTSTASSSSVTSSTVFASAARGVRIAGVQYRTGNVVAAKRLPVVVTLRDLAGRRIRHAIVSIGPLAGAQRTPASTAATYTNRLGQATVPVAVTSTMLGRRVLMKITARTPSARAVTVGSVLLPGIAPR